MKRGAYHCLIINPLQALPKAAIECAALAVIRIE
jgi:hypothetical protein